MKELVDKLVAVEQGISDEKGGFALFGLFLRQEAVDRWDLVVSAPWFGAHDKKALDYIAKELKSRLLPEELISLSRIVLLDQGNPGLEAIHLAFSVEHGRVELKNTNLFGMPIEHAYIITSRREDSRPAVGAS